MSERREIESTLGSSSMTGAHVDVAYDAVAMDPDYMDFKVRVRCGRCGTINVPDTDEAADRERWRARQRR